MIHWRPVHSAFLSAVSLSAALLIFYLAGTMPFAVPTAVGGIMMFLIAVLLGSTIDHGLQGAPRAKRWKRFGLSTLTIWAWIYVGQNFMLMLSPYQSTSWLVPRTAEQWVETLKDAGWILLLSIPLALLGMLLARWFERLPIPAVTRLDQTKQKT